MRVLLSAALTCCAIVGLTNASEAQAVMRKATNIPAQALRPALHLLSQEREVQVVFRTDIVADLRTSGASGELTVDEVLNQLLSGTGLTYRYLDDNTITVVPSRAVTPLSSTEVGAAESKDEEAPRDFWTRLRLSQASQSSQSSESVSRKSDTDSTSSGNQGSQNVIEEIRVIAAPYRFLDADTSGTTNLPLPIEKVPQSITLLSADFMKAAGIRKASDLDNYVAGLSDGGERIGLFSSQNLRGFATSEYFSTYIDGLPIPFYTPEFSFFDRVEIVKGPSSVTYGVATPGGLYNYVPKHAPKTPSGRVSVESGSWRSYRAEIEGGSPLNRGESLRGIVAAVYDAGDSFVHHYDHDYSSGYGALEYSGGGKLSGAFRANFTKRSSTTNDGLLFYSDGRRPDVSRGFFMGDPDRNRIDQEVSAVSMHMGFRAMEGLDLSAKASYQDNSFDRYLAYGSGTISNDGTYTMNGSESFFDQRVFAASLSGLWSFPTFGNDGSFLSVSATHIDQRFSNGSTRVSFNGGNNNIANLSEGEQGLYGKIRQWTLNEATATASRDNGTDIEVVSAQSGIKSTNNLLILAGVSISDPTQRTSLRSVPTTIKFEQQTSFRGGLVYEFHEKSNAYVSYSESFEPQVRYDANRNLLPPLEGSQWEAGVKSRQRDGNLLLTAAAFRIEQKNTPFVAGIDPSFGTYFRAQGEVRHQGLELEAAGLATPSLTILAALTYLDAKIIADANPALIGTRRTFIPRQTASMFAVKAFDGGALRGFNVGGGVRYVDGRPTSADGSTHELDDYTVIDLIAGYKSRHWSAHFSLNNILDKDYVQGNNYGSLAGGKTIGEPRNVRLSISWDFGGDQ